jgi:hypothetical protein
MSTRLVVTPAMLLAAVTAIAAPAAVLRTAAVAAPAAAVAPPAAAMTAPAVVTVVLIVATVATSAKLENVGEPHAYSLPLFQEICCHRPRQVDPSEQRVTLGIPDWALLHAAKRCGFERIETL